MTFEKITKTPTIGLGILSWHGAASLEQALESYLQEDFFGIFDEAVIFLPEPDKDVLEVAGRYPLRIETSPENKGIMSGMESVASFLSTDYVFLTENDCPLLARKKEAKSQIFKAVDLIQKDEAIMARMRHVKNPGEAFETYNKYLRYFPQNDTLSARLRRILRPGKAKRLSGTAIYVESHPDKKFPSSISAAGDEFYLVDTETMPWTNQSIVIDRSFFLKTILPFAHSVPFRRGANGFKNLEVELNQSKFWTRSNWKIACGPGLLTHRRAEHRGY